MDTPNDSNYNHKFYMDFMQIDFCGFENIQQIFAHAFGYFDYLYTQEFKGVNPHYAIGIVDKCVSAAQACDPGADGENLRSLSIALTDVMNGTSVNRTRECNVNLSQLIGLLSSLYNSIMLIGSDEENRIFSFYGFYNPDVSNKNQAIELLKAAIERIQETDDLKPDAKRKLILRIEKLIKELEKEKTDWSMFYGDMKQTVIVLAALAQIASSSVYLADSLGFLKEAEKTVSETSISQNYQIAIQNQYFVHNDNKVLMLNCATTPEDN